MKKYCRYCCYCISGDCYYCTEKKKVLGRVDRPVFCNDFVLSGLGDVDTGKQYQPRQTKEKPTTEQVSLFAEKE